MSLELWHHKSSVQKPNNSIDSVALFCLGLPNKDRRPGWSPDHSRRRGWSTQPTHSQRYCRSERSDGDRRHIRESQLVNGSCSWRRSSYRKLSSDRHSRTGGHKTAQQFSGRSRLPVVPYFQPDLRFKNYYSGLCKNYGTLYVNGLQCICTLYSN